MLFKGGGVSNHEEIVFGSRYCHIYPSLVSKETKTTRIIAPDTVDYNDVFLTPLICIHSINLDISRYLRAPYFSEPGINRVFKNSHLCLVRGDNTYFSFKIAKTS
jgi:hypothetical protein